MEFPESRRSVHSNSHDGVSPSGVKKSNEVTAVFTVGHVGSSILLISGQWKGRMRFHIIHFCECDPDHRLSVYLHRLQLVLDFFVNLLQLFLGELLSGPSDYQATLVGLLRFGDDVEVDMRNDLGDHSSTKDCGYRRYCGSHLVSNFSVILSVKVY